MFNIAERLADLQGWYASKIKKWKPKHLVATLPHTEWFGLKPSREAVGSLIYLIILAGVIASIALAISSATITLSSLLSASVITMAAIIGLGYLKHHFDLQMGLMPLQGVRPIKPGELKGDRHNPDYQHDLNRQDKHLGVELAALHKVPVETLKARRVVARFNDHHPKIVGIAGRNLGQSATAFSDGMLQTLRPRQLAALHMVELEMAYQSDRHPHRVAEVVTTVTKTLEGFAQSTNPILWVLGTLSGIDFFLFWQKTLNRQRRLDAFKLVANSKRGNDLLDAMNHLWEADEVGMDNNQKGVNFKRARYSENTLQDRMDGSAWLRYFSFFGRMADGVLEPISDFIREYELTPNAYQVVSLVDILVFGVMKAHKENFSDQPSGSSMKDAVLKGVEKYEAAEAARLEPQLTRFLFSDAENPPVIQWHNENLVYPEGYYYRKIDLSVVPAHPAPAHGHHHGHHHGHNHAHDHAQHYGHPQGLPVEVAEIHQELHTGLDDQQAQIRALQDQIRQLLQRIQAPAPLPVALPLVPAFIAAGVIPPAAVPASAPATPRSYRDVATNSPSRHNS